MTRFIFLLLVVVLSSCTTVGLEMYDCRTMCESGVVHEYKFCKCSSNPFHED